MDSSNEEPLPNNCLKHVLKHLSLKRREQIGYLSPTIRATNSALPYNLESVSIGDCFLRVNKREWNVFTVHREPTEEPPEGEDIEWENVPNRASIRFRFDNYLFIHEVEGEPAEAFKKLFDDYFKNGTKIKRLQLYSLPECLKDKNPEKFKLIVEELQIRNSNYETFQMFKPFFDESKPLKKIGFTFRDSNRPFFDEPMVRKSEEIFLQFPYYDPDPMNDILCTLSNKHILMTYLNLPIVKIQELAAYWKKVLKPIGHTYSLVIDDYSYIAQVFDNLKEHLGAVPSKLTHLGDLFFAHCVALPVDEHSEIVVYGGRATIKWPPLIWALKMEVMPRGSTVAK